MTKPSSTEPERSRVLQPSENQQPPQGQENTVFPIVGIGASAGGLEAFSQLLEHLPKHPGLAFVLVQHLTPKQESRLVDILTKATTMPVVEAANGLAVRPDHVYVIPPNTTLSIKEGILHLEPRGEGRGPHLPVDFFFKTLAADRQSGAIGVILSGTGSDGTLGLEEIKAAGGITLAQDEQTARYDGMPLSAIRSGCVDAVLSPEGLAHELTRIGKHPYVQPAPPAKQELQGEEEDDFKKILGQLRATFGVDFNAYRDTTLRRRIMRRMVLHHKEDLNEYFQLLTQDRAELDALYEDILINVTSFFREPEAFEALKQVVFPEILKGKTPDTPIRLWVPGCSTGQEAYSLAIALLEFLDEKKVRLPIQIFATDLSDNVSLQKAREGVYPENIEAEVSPERLRRFFSKEDAKYRINKLIRDLCVFAKQNVAADPPFSRVDLISCRNLLIYLSAPLQRRVIPTFHYALNPTGYLMLGSAETIGSFNDLFELVDPKHRIYIKKPALSRPYPYFHVDEIRTELPGTRGRVPQTIAATDWQREADRLVLNQYAPSGVLVNANLDVLHFRGQTGAYLAPAPGEASLNVLKMTREGLFLELRNALEESKRMNAEVRRERVPVRTDATIREINLRVLPVRLPGSSESCYLILFEEPGAPALPRAAQSSSREASAAAAEPPAAEGQGFFGRLRRWLAPLPDPGGPSPSEQEIRQLRQELAATREYLQSVIEQQDAANEELKSANEEILSSNEELQSTNEELETAKEELQSVNEELTTINEQLQTRNADLSRLNDDLANLLGSANVPMVVLGIDLRIRRFTPAAGRLLNLLPTDVGRPISNLKLTIEVSDLESMVTGVIDTVRVVEREIRDLHGHWYDLRIHPYRTADNKIDGAVVVLQDIDQLKRAQEELQRQATQLRRQTSLIELSQDAIIVRDTTDVIVFWNRGAQEMYGWSRDEALGKKTHELLQTTCANTPDGMDAQLLKDGEWEGELGQTRRGGTPLIVYSRQVLVREKGETPPAILEINRDITERKRTEQLLQQQAEALRQADRRKNEFLATLAHELRNPLSPIVNALQILRLENNDPSRLVAMRDMLERQTQQLSRIVEDLLDMTRIVEGKIELRKERVALSQAVATALESSRSLIDRSGHQLTVKLPAEPVYVEADPVRLAQILTNLLNNAAKFTETGGQIWLTARRDVGSRPPGEVNISVRDSGIGIALELLPHIFEMFTQGDRSLGRTRSGLGVGLALVHSLVRMHGGFIEAQSEGPGKGSEFIVHLPLAPEPSPLMGPPAPPPAAASVLQPGTSQAGPFPSRRILVVDDNHDQAQTLGMLLELMGYEVHVEHDGPSAVRAALKMIPEVALIDIGLPGMNGYEVARELRQHPELEHMVLVAQTGWGQEEDRQRSRAAGFDYHLVKPVDHFALQNVLKAHRGE